MSNPIIKAEEIGKKYILSHQKKQPYHALRDVMADAVKKWGRKLLHPLPSRREPDPTHEEFWALKDVSFEINQGDRVGIIGRNGAGKSTLLKILSRITEPTTGQVTIDGRVASLLEVGTGFHPELTGRENIYLNGAILGMTRAEIKRKFDEIVDFAEVEKFLDTPVKRYSSGMYVRLAFSVAAHLEPEVLVVDEVLAVGDAQFQKKCLGKMEDIGNTGRTILFVSHNMNIVRQLCNKGILLENGRVKFIGDAVTVVSEYLTNHYKNNAVANLASFANSYGNDEIKVYSIELLNSVGNSFAAPWDEPLKLRVKFRLNRDLNDVTFGIGCTTLENVPLFTVRSSDSEGKLMNLKIKEVTEITITIYHNLRAGLYNLLLGISCGNYVYYYHPAAAQLEILNSGEKRYLDNNIGLINCASEWLLE